MIGMEGTRMNPQGANDGYFIVPTDESNLAIPRPPISDEQCTAFTTGPLRLEHAWQDASCQGYT